MKAEVFRISSDLNESMALSAIEDATTDVLSEDGRPNVLTGSDPQPAIDADVLRFLFDEGLDDALDVPTDATRADIAVTVDRWLAALYGCHERIAEITVIRDRRVAMVTGPFNDQLAMHERRAAYLDGVLTQMARSFPYPAGSKSFALAFGKIGKRAQSPKLVVTDSAAVIAYAREHVPEAVEDVPTLRKDPLNAWWVSVGEVEVPGCTIERPAEHNKPYVKVRPIS